MKIAITGCAGLIGSALTRVFITQGHSVVGIDNFIGGYTGNIPHNTDRFEYFNINVEQDFSALKEAFRGVDKVFHCAALAYEGLSVFSPALVTKNIYGGTMNAISAAVASKVPYFMNFSSMARYGEEPFTTLRVGPPFEESMVCLPVDPYGLAKLQAEQSCDLMSDIHGIKVHHVVPHNVAGPGQIYFDPFRNVISIFGNLLLNNKSIFIYGDGTQKRSFSHIDDCVMAILRLSESEIESKEVFNIGPGEGTEITINELARIVAKYCQTELNIEYYPSRPREVKHAWVSIDKAKSLLDYHPKHTSEDTVRDTINWIRQQPIIDFNYNLEIEIVNDKTPKTWVNKLFSVS